MKILERLKSLFRVLIGRPTEPQAPSQPPVVAEPPLALSGSDASPIDAVWSFRGAILDRLDEYFECVRRVRRLDPESYDFFSRVGFSVPADAWVAPETMATYSQRPSFGGCLFGGMWQTRPDNVYPSFCYFRKVDRPIGVTRPSRPADVYLFAVLYDSRNAQEHRFRCGNFCHVALYADGSAEVLAERVRHSERIDIGKGRKRRSVDLTSQRWEVPQWVPSMDLEDEAHDARKDYVLQLFRMTMATHLNATSQLLIRAKRGACAAMFGIGLQHTGRFFKDRDRVLATDGRRKRIFHIVTEHKRELASGVVTEVRQHYRGVRAFRWKTYDIKIVLPQRAGVIEFDKPSVEAERDTPGFMASDQAGETIAMALEA